MEGKMFDDGWKGLSDQVGTFLYSVILYVIKKLPSGVAGKLIRLQKKLPLGMGYKRKEDGLGLLESGLQATKVWGVGGN